jgi:hypothetical protein
LKSLRFLTLDVSLGKFLAFFVGTAGVLPGDRCHHVLDPQESGSKWSPRERKMFTSQHCPIHSWHMDDKDKQRTLC